MKQHVVFAFALALCGCKEAPSHSATSIPAPKLGPPKPMALAPVSFTDNVATVLVSRCVKCHIEDSKGGFNTATFTALMKGGESGPVVIPGKPDESRLVQLIESDKMPAQGRPLSEEYKTDIREWVEKGAKFDGPAEDAKLMDYVMLPEDTEAREGSREGGRRSQRRSGADSWNPVNRFDKNGDEKLTKDEVQGRMKERFDEIDANKDGAITIEEFNARMEGRTGGGDRGSRDGKARPTGDQPKRPPFDDQ